MNNLNLFAIALNALTRFFRNKPIIVNYINCFITELNIIYQQFITLREEIVTFLFFSGRIADLEYLLNKLFNNSGTEIYIRTNSNLETYLFLDSEQMKEIFLDFNNQNESPVYLFNVTEQLNTGSFTVFVPASLIINTNSIKLILNKYKIAGKTYNIVSY